MSLLDLSQVAIGMVGPFLDVVAPITRLGSADQVAGLSLAVVGVALLEARSLAVRRRARAGWGRGATGGAADGWDVSMRVTERESEDSALVQHRARARGDGGSHRRVLRAARCVLEATAGGVLVLDLDRNILVYNEQVKEIWKVSDQILTGDRRALVARLRAMVEDGDAVGRMFLSELQQPEEGVLRLKDGRVVERVRRPLRMRGAVVGAVLTFRDVTEHVSAEEALRVSEERFRRMVEGVSEHAIYSLDREGRITSWNAGASQVSRYEDEEVLGRPVSIFYTPEDVEAGEPVRALRLARTQGRFEGEGWRVRGDGTRFWGGVLIQPMYDETGAHIGFVHVTHDLSRQRGAEEELRQREEELRQAQKIEAVGRLAGGIAHDFNNILTAIGGFAKLLDLDLPEEDGRRAYLAEIERAKMRGASLTSQLLAFSRRQVTAPKVLETNAMVTELSQMLRRVIGEDIELSLSLQPGVRNIRFDPGQLHQVLMNLAVNARDAMPDGGQLRLSTGEMVVEAQQWGADVKVDPGLYVRIDVEDTGCGMDPDVAERAFEPFFTTKPRGVGTGLGLSTVYGIVKQGGGFVWADSEPGVGTRFSVYLPAAEEDSSTEPERVERKALVKGSGTLLLVEDETSVRLLTSTLLRRSGYEVYEANGAEEAERLFSAHADEISLVLTDVVLPRVSGVDLAESLARMKSDLKVVYMSGYPEPILASHGILAEGVTLIQKPFTAETLTETVFAALEEGVGGRAIRQQDRT